MSCLAPSTSLQSTEGINQGAVSCESQLQRYVSFCHAYWLVSEHGPSCIMPRMCSSPHSVSIHILDDDSLLNVFYLYRPFLLGEDDDNDAYLLGGKGGWIRGRWWYRLAHVCQRWRAIILGSAFYLGISLVCTKGTPVADMLANSPSLPLVIDYSLKYDDITAEDEERAILALKQRDRVRRVRLDMPVTSLRKLIVAMDEEYPILEHLIVIPRIKDINTILMFRDTFQAPHLSHLTLSGFILPIGSRLLTTAVDLVTLHLIMTHPSTYFYPNTLLRWVSFMPKLETLVIIFSLPVFNRDVEMQLTHTPIMAPVALPNLHRFTFRGFITYSEGLVHQIITPHLEKLQIDFFFNQLTFSVPRLLEFMNTIENPRFDSAVFKFSNGRVDVEAYPRGQTEMLALSIVVDCWHLDWQVSSVAQISDSLSPMFSTVEHLALEHEVHNWSSEEHNEVDHTEWRRLLNSFRHVKTLRIDIGLVGGLSRCLEVDDGEPRFELLPELQELTYSGGGSTGDSLALFIDARQNTGRPITLVRRSANVDQANQCPL